MARTNLDGKSIKLVLRWLLNREDLQDADIAAALGYTASSYSRHKDDDDFPSFEELEKLGRNLGVSPVVLQIAFGLRNTSELILLDDEEMRQYLEQGGANHPHHPPLVGARKEERKKTEGGRRTLIPTPAMIRGMREVHRTGTTPSPRGAPWANRPSA